MYKLKYSKRAQKDAKKLKSVGLKNKAVELLQIIHKNPFQNPPPYEKMFGYSNVYSRRINKQHRIVYEVYEEIIIIAKMWTHYE